MVTAHEADILHMRNLRRTDVEKDLKPDTFESNEKSKLSFRQWSDEFSSWVERIDQDFETMLKLATQMQEWDKDKFIAAAQQDCRLEAEKVAEFDKHIHLAGDLQQVPTHRPLSRKKCARRNRHCQSTPRIEATSDCKIFPLAERDQEVGQRVCWTVAK